MRSSFYALCRTILLCETTVKMLQGKGYNKLRDEGVIVWEEEEEGEEEVEEEEVGFHVLPIDMAGFRAFHRRVYRGTLSPTLCFFFVLFPPLTPQSSTLTLG